MLIKSNLTEAHEGSLLRSGDGCLKRARRKKRQEVRGKKEKKQEARKKQGGNNEKVTITSGSNNDDVGAKRRILCRHNNGSLDCQWSDQVSMYPGWRSSGMR